MMQILSFSLLILNAQPPNDVLRVSAELDAC